MSENVDVDKTWNPDPKTGLPTLDEHREIELAKVNQSGFGSLKAPKQSDESIPEPVKAEEAE